jgi:hypothetical protein
METPKGKQVKMTKLGGARWRLETNDGAHQIFIEKVQDAVLLERADGSRIGTYTEWSPAIRVALRTFDQWNSKKEPSDASVDEAADEAILQISLEDLLEKMKPLEEKMVDLGARVTDPVLRETITPTEWMIVRQATRFARSMIRYHDLQQIRLEKRR